MGSTNMTDINPSKEGDPPPLSNWEKQLYKLFIGEMFPVQNHFGRPVLILAARKKACKAATADRGLLAQE